MIGVGRRISLMGEQLNTTYSQVDFMQKIRFDANQHWSFMLNTQASSSTNIPRFDKLNDVSDAGEGNLLFGSMDLKEDS